MGLLCPISDLPTNGLNYFLGCLKQNNEIIYYNNLFDNCYPINQSVLEYSKQNDIRIRKIKYIKKTSKETWASFF